MAALASGVLHPGWRGQRPSGRLTFMRLAILSVHILYIRVIDPLTMTGACVHALTSFPQWVASRATAAAPRSASPAEPLHPAVQVRPRLCYPCAASWPLQPYRTGCDGMVQGPATVASARRAAQKDTSPGG